MRIPIVAGNWKMNGSQAMAGALVDALVKAGPIATEIEVIVCPPASLLTTVHEAATGSGIQTGAQDIDPNESGAFTGQISASLAKDAGASHVIIGHSERRTLYGETDALVADKVEAALGADLTPIFCVGETQAQREAGETMAVIDKQINAVLNQSGIEGFARIVVAYEPVWAIGTGLTATPAEAQEVHAHIRNLLAGSDGEVATRCRIIYGGSMKPDNAEALIAEKDIDGGLIGGASLDAKQFLSICRAAASLRNPK